MVIFDGGDRNLRGVRIFSRVSSRSDIFVEMLVYFCFGDFRVRWSFGVLVLIWGCGERFVDCEGLCWRKTKCKGNV